MPHQFPLLPPVQQCPGCNREVYLLGQWHPWSKAYLCRDCSIRYPMPDIYEPHKPKVKQENTPELDAGRTMNVAMENALFRLRKGCILTLDQAMSKEGLPCSEMRGQRTLYIWDCAKCRRDAAYETEIIRRGGIHRLQRLGRNGLYAPEKTARAYTLSLPFCERCGAAHNERFRDGEAKQYCQPCQDKWTVESYYNNRGIFGNDDVEEIMDRIQKASPDLFKRGVLPDYWFELSLKEKTVE